MRGPAHSYHCLRRELVREAGSKAQIRGGEGQLGRRGGAALLVRASFSCSAAAAKGWIMHSPIGR